MEQQIIGQPVKTIYIVKDSNGTCLSTAEGLYEYALRMYPKYIDEIDDITNPIDCIDFIDRQSEGEVDVECWFYEAMPLKTID